MCSTPNVWQPISAVCFAGPPLQRSQDSRKVCRAEILKASTAPFQTAKLHAPLLVRGMR